MSATPATKPRRAAAVIGATVGGAALALAAILGIPLMSYGGHPAKAPAHVEAMSYGPPPLMYYGPPPAP